MKRKVVSLLLITLPFLLAVVILQVPVTAAPGAQTVPADDAPTPLAQPQQIVIRQQVPLTFTVAVSTPMNGAGANPNNLIGSLLSSIAQPTPLTPTMTTQTVVVTLTLDLQLTVTDTLTTTVPSTVTLTLADSAADPSTATFPVSVTVGPAPAAAVVITLLTPPSPPVTETRPLTETATITPGGAVSPTTDATITTTVTAPVTTTTSVTTPALSELVAITGTVTITANLRSGPDTTFDAPATTTAGQAVTVVARNADGTWYLLDNGLWIAAFLVEGVEGQQLPVATDELVTNLRTQSAVTTPVTVTTPITTTPVTPTPIPTTETTPTTSSLILVPTPTAPAQPAQPPSVTVDANLRSGPGTTFPIIGGTVTGQTITIVARNADGSWFLLDNDGWVSANLVANPPALTAVPLFTEEGAATDNPPTATPTPLPSPTSAAIVTTTVGTPVLGVRENLYVIRIDGIVDGYDFALTKIDQLVTQASENEALLQDRAWIVEMTTAITLLRSTGDEVANLSAPALFADAHTDLTEAAAAFTNAADLLAEGVDQLDTERLDEAFAEITVGTSLLTRVQNAIATVTP